MPSEGLLITEIFESLQGETSLSGLPFTFVRLTGCNLRCTYCDTSYAFHGGAKMSVEDVIAKVEALGRKHVLLTGGEPLLQRATPHLARSLAERGYEVSIETHGEHPIQEVAGVARIVMDVKTPSSGMARGGFRSNLPLLRPTDEVKFVIASEGDYAWARDVVREAVIPTREILFSPALPARDTPGTYPGVRLEWLAARILEDGLPVRFQYQLHKLIWGSDARGV